MVAARHVGRIGSLACALGIGTGLTCTAAATVLLFFFPEHLFFADYASMLAEAMPK